MGFIWERCKFNGIIVAIIALLFAMFSPYLVPDKNVGLGIVIPFGIIFIFLLIVFVDAAYVSFKTNRNILPEVIYVEPYFVKNKETHLFLLTASDLFSNEILVSFYYYNDGYEQLIGVGRVFNIQDDNKIQVLLNYTFEGHSEKIEEIFKNNKKFLNKIKIKPSIPYSLLELELTQKGGKNE